MNNLSITLYAIDVIGNLNTVIGMVAIFSGILLLVCFIGAGITCDRISKSEAALNDATKRVIKTTLPFFIIATLVSIVVPDKRTVRLIVASEFGEALYKSEDVQEVLNPAKAALKKWLNDYTKDAK